MPPEKKSLGTIMLQHNALKYRGYYYEADLGLYYLGSRFYDQNICRFVNADTSDVLTVNPSSLTDKNLYFYCDNNPVIRIDSTGKLWVSLAIGASVGIATQLIADFGIGLVDGDSFKEIVSSLSPIDYVSAAVSGALAATGICTAGSVVANAFLGGATYLANCNYKEVDANMGELITSTAIGALSGRIGGSGIDGKNLRGVYKYSQRVIDTTTSVKKATVYKLKQSAAKKSAVVGGLRTFVAGVFSNVTNYFRKKFTKSKA